MIKFMNKNWLCIFLVKSILYSALNNLIFHPPPASPPPSILTHTYFYPDGSAPDQNDEPKLTKANTIGHPGGLGRWEGVSLQQFSRKKGKILNL